MDMSLVLHTLRYSRAIQLTIVLLAGVWIKGLYYHSQQAPYSWRDYTFRTIFIIRLHLTLKVGVVL